MAGTTLLQRKNAGKLLAPLANGLIPWGRQSDGLEFVMTVQQLADVIDGLNAAPVVTTQSANYTARAVDAFTIIEFTGLATFTLPTDAAAPLMAVQSVIDVVQIGAGQLNWPAGVTAGAPTAIGGVTYRIPVGLLTPVRNVTYAWRKRAANDWILT